jgi:tryptophan synthase beta chain
MTTSLSPNKPRGYFGNFGGAYVPEILTETFRELEAAFAEAQADPTFWPEYEALMGEYSCRPTPLTFAENLTRDFGGARIFVKREDLNHTGAHKANNVLGQGLLVKRMGKKRVIAETGAGQHGVATATMAAKFGFECTVYMGEVDVERQRPNVFWMERLGAKVVSVKDGSRTLKDAINEAFRDWAANMDTTHYVLGTACGPHPFPTMVAYFQSIVGKELRGQVVQAHGTPAEADLCVCGRWFERTRRLWRFSRRSRRRVGWRRSRRPWSRKPPARRAPSLAGCERRCGAGLSYLFLCKTPTDKCSTPTPSPLASTTSACPPSLSHLREQGRVRFEAATDKEVVAALALAVRREGLIPALESSHAFAQAFKEASTLSSDDVIVINQSGRGDKDIFTVAEAFGDPAWEDFICRKAKKYAR